MGGTAKLDYRNIGRKDRTSSGFALAFTMHCDPATV